MEKHALVASAVALALAGCGGEPTATSFRDLEQAGHVSAEQRGERIIHRTAGAGGAVRIERSDPAQIAVGEPFTYAIRVTNVTEQPLHDVVVSETVPDAIEIVSAELEDGDGEPSAAEPERGQAAGDRPVRTWRLGTLDPDESHIVRVEAIARRAGTAETRVRVSLAKDLPLRFAVVDPEVRLAREVLIDGEPGERGYRCQELALRYRVANTGTGTTGELVLTEDLPEGLRTADGEPRIRFTIDPLAAGETVERLVRLEAERRAAFSGRATLAAGEETWRSEPADVLIMAPALALDVEAPERAKVGQLVGYRVRLRNPSEDPARGTRLRILPGEALGELEVVSGEASIDDHTIDVGELPAGAERTVVVRGVAREPGELAAAIAATARCVDPVSREIRTTVEPVAAALLEAIDSDDPVRVGETTTYRVRVANQGSQEALDVRLRAELPEGLEAVDAEGPTAVSVSGRTIAFSPLARLDPGDEETWTITARATAAGKHLFRVALTSAASDRPVSEQESTTVLERGADEVPVVGKQTGR